MKKALLFLLGGLLAAGLLGVIAFHLFFHFQKQKYRALLGEAAPELEQGGHRFRDLNKNGLLDSYEDSRKTLEERVEDLLFQMTLEEKAGLMFINMVSFHNDGTLVEKPRFSDPTTFVNPSTSLLVAGKLMNHFNLFKGIDDPLAAAKWHNALQRLASRTRLGIPVTLATDPRNGYGGPLSPNLPPGRFSQWCEPLGLASIGDTALTLEFADMARQEYLAVGLRLALHPMADLATEPRWARINGTFGEDAQLASAMVRAYVRGFQGDSLGAKSVACMTKHFSGGGPQKDGWDGHFSYGRDQVYPGDNFAYHLIPFEEGAFPAGTAQIMPYYGIPVGQTSEDVGFAFNREIITGMLRERYGFDGVVCSDWGLISDQGVGGIVFKEAACWGVDSLSPLQRAHKLLDAGIDQFGGEQVPELVVELVKSGLVSESRIDASVRRLLRDKFRLGLFDNPYVDEAAAQEVIGKPEFTAAGAQAQRKAMVLLKNEQGILPLEKGVRLYVENLDPEVAALYGTVVANIEDADVALLRLNTPFEKRTGSFLESLFHQGDLDFKGEEKAHVLEVANSLPTIVNIYLDRPAVMPEIAAACSGLLANFGASDEAVLDVVFGQAKPEGKLPFELPSSMEAVRQQKEDLPHDSEVPLYEFGFGLRY